MNIGSLFRGLLGDSKPGEAKALELKEGQVVRGVVLSVSESGKEAVVQIQGTPVRAELETPLQPGQSMTLQVAPPGEGGLPVLKSVPAGDAALASPQNMGETLEMLGLKESKASKEIVQAMQSGGLPLTKETAAKLEAVMSAKPQGVSTSEWLESAVLSLKRGLPVTAESVRGLQQAVFGPKLHELLAKLETELSLWAQQEADNGKPGASATRTGTDTPANTAAGGRPAAGAGEAAVGTKAVAQPASPQAGSLTALAENGAGETAAAKEAAGPGSNAVKTGGAAENAKGAMQAENTGSADGAGSAKGNGNAEGAGSARGAGSAEGTGSARGAGSAEGARGAGSAEGAGSVKGAGSAEGTGSAKGAGGAEGAGNVRGTGSAESAGNVKGTGSAESAGGARGTGSAESAGDARGTGSAGSAGDARGTGSAGSAGDGEGAGSASAARNAGALLAKLQGVLTELRGTLPQLIDQAGAAAQPEADAPPAAAGQDPARAAAPPRGDSPAAAQQPGQAPAPAQDASSWVGRVLKLLGAEHEQQAVRGGTPAAGGREAALPPAALQAAAGGADAAADTLKGVLLQVMGSSEAPPAVKDAAGQLVAQLTGQQLLLNTDRTAPFAQVTLFLPLHGPDGQETASVHIQSRRGRKGELDAANCRLWFDLDMKQLGQTLVDVQVVDRIVSLKLHNNDPWMLELLEGRREDIAAAVESIGYQLSSLRTEPLPELKTAASGAAAAAKLAEFTPDSYKGVDFRI